MRHKDFVNSMIPNHSFSIFPVFSFSVEFIYRFSLDIGKNK